MTIPWHRGLIWWGFFIDTNPCMCLYIWQNHILSIRHYLVHCFTLTFEITKHIWSWVMALLNQTTGDKSDFSNILLSKSNIFHSYILNFKLKWMKLKQNIYLGFYLVVQVYISFIKINRIMFLEWFINLKTVN